MKNKIPWVKSTLAFTSRLYRIQPRLISVSWGRSRAHSKGVQWCVPWQWKWPCSCRHMGTIPPGLLSQPPRACEACDPHPAAQGLPCSGTSASITDSPWNVAPHPPLWLRSVYLIPDEVLCRETVSCNSEHYQWAPGSSVHYIFRVVLVHCGQFLILVGANAACTPVFDTWSLSSGNNCPCLSG